MLPLSVGVSPTGGKAGGNLHAPTWRGGPYRPAGVSEHRAPRGPDDTTRSTITPPSSLNRVWRCMFTPPCVTLMPAYKVTEQQPETQILLDRGEGNNPGITSPCTPAIKITACTHMNAITRHGANPVLMCHRDRDLCVLWKSKSTHGRLPKYATPIFQSVWLGVGIEGVVEAQVH